MRKLLLLTLSLLPYAAAQEAAQQFQTLYRFEGAADGSDPDSVPPLTMGAGGVLYGLTGLGGTFGGGTAYSLTPPSSPGGAWTEAVLHSFGGPGDGSGTYSGLAWGSDGALYGVTEAGGAYGNGTVFSLAPPATPGGDWTETVIYSFGARANDGAQPYGTPVFGKQGVMYGTTTTGGVGSGCPLACGIAFSLTPPAAPGGAWTEAILHTFGQSGDGLHPASSLLIGHDGALYGTTVIGPTVYRLAPPKSGSGEWTESILALLGDTTIGDLQRAGAVYYGTTESSVFSLTPPRKAGGAWKYAVLVDNLPLTFGGVAVNKGTGALYFATFYGGAEGFGAIFKLTPPASPGGAWINTWLYNFSAGDGSYPVQGVLLSNGVLYGTTPCTGGDCSGAACGTVYSFTLGQ